MFTSHNNADQTSNTCYLWNANDRRGSASTTADHHPLHSFLMSMFIQQIPSPVHHTISLHALHNFTPNIDINTLQKQSKYIQHAQLSQRDRTAGCAIVFAKSRRLELRDNILRT